MKEWIRIRGKWADIPTPLFYFMLFYFYNGGGGVDLVVLNMALLVLPWFGFPWTLFI